MKYHGLQTFSPIHIKNWPARHRKNTNKQTERLESRRLRYAMFCLSNYLSTNCYLYTSLYPMTNDQFVMFFLFYPRENKSAAVVLFLRNCALCGVSAAELPESCYRNVVGCYWFILVFQSWAAVAGMFCRYWDGRIFCNGYTRLLDQDVVGRTEYGKSFQDAVWGNFSGWFYFIGL